MIKHNLTATFMALSMILILGVVFGGASLAPVRRVSPASVPARLASRPGGLLRIGNRYALVIGNAIYRNIVDLENTVNDAKDIAAALEELGFDVDLVLNATEDQFDAAINAHIARLEAYSANEGFFWYAGHGVQIRDQNYLLPVDASEESGEDHIYFDLENCGLRNLIIP
jgi:hypothetical protein